MSSIISFYFKTEYPGVTAGSITIGGRIYTASSSNRILSNTLTTSITIGTDFSNNTNLLAFDVSGSLYVNISAYGFANCTNLYVVSYQNCNMTAGTITFGAYSFWNCSNLYLLILPENNSVGTHIIQNNVFTGCTNIKYIYFQRARQLDSSSNSLYTGPTDVTVIVQRGAVPTSSSNWGLYAYFNGKSTIIDETTCTNITRINAPYTIFDNYLDPSFLYTNVSNNIKTKYYISANTTVASFDSSSNNTVTIGNVGITPLIVSQDVSGTTHTSKRALSVLVVDPINATITLSNTDSSGNVIANYLGSNILLNGITDSNTSITYTSANTLVGTVDVSGNIKIGNAGTTIIYANSASSNNYLSTSKIANLRVNPINSTITLNNTDSSGNVTANYLGANVLLNGVSTSNTSITYTSANTLVGTVDIIGNIKIGNAGTSIIYANSASSNNYNLTTITANLTVNPINSTIILNNTDPSGNVIANYLGSNILLNGISTSNTSITYTSANTFVGTVDVSGNIKIGNAGTAIIYANSASSNNYNLTSKIANLRVNPINSTITLNNTDPSGNITANYLGSNVLLNGVSTSNTSITYTSANTFVGTLDVSGNIQIGNVGTTIIYANSASSNNYNLTTITANLTVNPINSTITLNNTDSSGNVTAIYLGSNILLNGITTSNTPITYTSANTLVGTVDVSGNVKIGNAGTTIIYANSASSNNYNLTSKIANLIISPFPTILTIGNSTLVGSPDINGNTHIPVGSLISPFNLNIISNNINTPLTYISSYTNVATVDTSGNITITGSPNTTSNITISQASTSNFNAVTLNLIVDVTKNQSIITAASPVTKISALGTTFNLNASTNNIDSQIINYNLLSNPYIASIDTSGNVNLLSTGTILVSLSQPETTLFYAAAKTVTINSTLNTQNGFSYLPSNQNNAIIMYPGAYLLSSTNKGSFTIYCSIPINQILAGTAYSMCLILPGYKIQLFSDNTTSYTTSLLTYDNSSNAYMYVSIPSPYTVYSCKLWYNSNLINENASF